MVVRKQETISKDKGQQEGRRRWRKVSNELEIYNTNLFT